MYIPTCAAKLDKEYSAYIQGRRKKQLYGTAGIELCFSANLRNFHKCGEGELWHGGVSGFEEGRSETRKGSFVS